MTQQDWRQTAPGSDPSSPARVLIGTSNSITIDNLDINLQRGEHRDVVLSISPRPRANPQHEPETAEIERMTLNATFTMFGQRDQTPIIPGLLELRDAVSQIVDECRRVV